eukprot:210813_1
MNRLPLLFTVISISWIRIDGNTKTMHQYNLGDADDDHQYKIAETYQIAFGKYHSTPTIYNNSTSGASDTLANNYCQFYYPAVCVSSFNDNDEYY